MRRESETNNLPPIPTYLEGRWWAKKLIAHTIFMCLNLWQIRNEALAANNEKLQYIQERNDLLKQALAIQQLPRSTTIDKRFANTFVCSYATLTTYTNERLTRWISMAQRALNYDPNRAGGQRTIRTFTLISTRITDDRRSDNRPDIRTPRISEIRPEHRPPDNRTPDIPLPGDAN